MSHKEYFEPDIVQRMYENNILFYKQAEECTYDIHKFARKMLRGRWNGLSVVRFLAFRAKEGHERLKIVKTLDVEYPSWKAELTWTSLLWELDEM